MSILNANISSIEEANRRIYGVIIGIVTNNKDPEKLGRVKLKLPVRECQNETAWVRVATLMAGKEMGVYFLPEVGDEVLVIFNNGDVHQPYVIGALWSETDKPPEQKNDGNNIRKIKTRSGHEIVFSDEKGNESVELHTSAKQSILLEDKDGGKITIKNGNGDNVICIDTAKNEISVSAKQKVSIKASSCSIDVNNSQINVDSSAIKMKSQSIDINADASINISCNGMMKIQGQPVKIN